MPTERGIMMRLKDPIAIQQTLIGMGYITVGEMHAKLGMSYNTFSKALAGKPVQPRTIKKFATGLGLKMLDVGEFVENS